MGMLQPDHLGRKQPWGGSSDLDDHPALAPPANEPSTPSRRVACTPSRQKAIYLDYAATTPVDPAVAHTMSNYLTCEGMFGNPASNTHAFGHAAAEAVAHAREEVASLLCVPPEEVVWTSGATEAINLAIKGVAFAHRGRGGHIVTSLLEHRAVLDAVGWLETEGFTVSYVEPDRTGAITPDGLAEALRPNTIMVSLMHVNNETGAISDLAALQPLVKRAGALLHVDAAQSAPRLPMDEVAMVADMVSVSSHKMYGPKGVGALHVRKNLQAKLVPLLHGGGHELGLRSGTLPTHQIAGMGHAARLVRVRRSVDTERIRRLDARLCAMFEQIGGLQFNGSPECRVPGIVSVFLSGVEAESLMLALGDIAISAGSACTSADVEPSHVLSALGYDADRAQSSVRFSLGRFTTSDEVDRAAQRICQAVAALRRISR